MMKNIKFILLAVIMGIFMANTAFASDEDDFYTLVDKCCDYFGYDSSVNQDVYNLWQHIEDLGYCYCVMCESTDDSDTLCIRFSDVELFPSYAENGLSYGYFATLSDVPSLTYCNIYFNSKSVFYDYGVVSNFDTLTSPSFGTYYTGSYLRMYQNILNRYELFELSSTDSRRREPIFVKNSNIFFYSYLGRMLLQYDDFCLFDYHYFLGNYPYFIVGDNIYYDDNNINVIFDMSDFGYNFPTGDFDLTISYSDFSDDNIVYLSNIDLNNDNNFVVDLSNIYSLDLVRFTYEYNGLYLYQLYWSYSDWETHDMLPFDFDAEYDDIIDDLPFESNSPDDLDLPFKDSSPVQNEIIDYIGFENDLVMLNEINKLDLSNVENKETAVMLKFVGYELFIVRVSLSVLVVCLITGFAWKNFGNMYEKIKKGRSNL